MMHLFIVLAYVFYGNAVYLVRHVLSLAKVKNEMKQNTMC